MKTFEYYDYNKDCTLSSMVDDATNVCGSAKRHLESIKNLFSSEEQMKAFFLLCIAYWSETEYYDERNQYAVLMSRELVKRFPSIKEETYDESLMLNAYAFVCRVHRYTQNEFFKAILEYLTDFKDYITEEMQFVIVDGSTMPYAEYRRTHYGY